MIIQKDRIPVKDVLLFGFLPGALKNFVYRLKGYKIGKKVSIGFGSVICGDTVTVGDYTQMGFFTIIRGKNITIGSHVNIGSATFLDTPHIEIGDDTKINEQVFVGGLQFPDSKFVLGRNCLVMQMSFINPARSIIVGDNSGIGGHCLLFGHSSYQSQLEGYPVEFDSIEIGDNVAITWRVFLLPGTKIGDGAVIGPNSLVRGAIPPKSLAIGFPARIVSKPPDFPKLLTEAERVEILQNIVAEMIKFFEGSSLTCSGNSDRYEITRLTRKLWFQKKKTWRLRIEYEAIDENKIPESYKTMDVFLSLKEIPKAIRRKLTAMNVMWIDIEKKEQPLFWNDLGDEVVLFLKRYGVKFFRVEE